MDRSKASSKASSQKKMTGHHGSEFFALGTKGTRDDAKSKLPSVKAAASAASKREAPSAVSNTAKKPKLCSMPVHLSADTDASSSGASYELWEQMATDCESVDLVDTIYLTLEQHDDEAVLRLLCGCIKQLIAAQTRPKPDMVMHVALSYIAKLRPDLFCNDIVTTGLLSVLRREASVKGRQNVHSQILAANLLAKGYNDKPQWPESFLRTYIEDAINDRIWVDNELCAPFLENICAVFETRTPLQSFLQVEGATSGASSSGGQQQHRDTTAIMNVDDDSGDNSIHGTDSSGPTRLGDFDSCMYAFRDMQYHNRFVQIMPTVEKYVTDGIKEQLNKRQQQDCYTRNFLKFLCTTSGLSEVRYLCITRLELWIHNCKLVKFAQQLLSYICFNVSSKCAKDHEVMAMLVKMRLKTKPLINFYMACLKEMILQKPDILNIVLKLVVQNELSNTRNPNNMGMLATMFQTCPDQSASSLAEIYKEFLLLRDDCLRTLRVFLRELVRMLRFDMNIPKFCKVFLNERPELTKQIEQSEFRERIFHSMVDITCLCMLLTASPQVREASISLRASRDVKNNPVLIKFYAHMSQIKLDAISWMYESVPKLFKLPRLDYNQALQKILLLDVPEQYSRCDQWPSEPERATLLRMVSETPIHEDALLRIILIGITKDIPLSISDTVEIIMLVIKTVSAMRTINCPAVQMNKVDIIDFLFSMTEYHHPENIKLPPDYDPPKLAITVLYWKTWIIMLMISAHNPSTFGAFCWSHYPTMKMLIEMCITNQFVENAMAKDELQILPIERDHILEFESYLAAQTSQAVITEENAILISQLMLLDPMGLARRVPPDVLEQLKHLNKTLKLGHLLCRSRKPDLLLDIIQRQGTTQSMPWLSDLVQNSEGDFNHLPVQCLCEFLMFNANLINEENSRDAELVNFLRNLILDPDSNKQTVCEVLDYIFRRLSSTVKQSRIAALAGIKLIFKSMDVDDNTWLLRSIPEIPHFVDVRAYIIPQLRSACQVENSPELVMSYIQFIAAHTLNDSVTHMLDHVIDMAQLIVERSTMFQHIIPATDAPSDAPIGEMEQESRFQTLKCLFVMFNNYVIKLREHHEPYEWTEYPDLLMVQFDDGVQLPLHLNIIHAFIILLTHSSNTMSESIPILDYWFPPGRTAPNAYLPNLTHEPVQLLPDWLKLKMIRSSVDRLIEAALHDLMPDQIVLFVQNFGTPVNSMSKLLALLDRAVIEQFDAVKNAILNKAYLSQLIEIQRARGAKNGHFTVQALGLNSHSQTVPDLPKIKCEVLEYIDLAAFPPVVPTGNVAAAARSSKETEEVINAVLKSPKELTSAQHYRFRRLINQLLGRCGATHKARKELQASTFTKALRTFERSKSVALFTSHTQKNHASTLLRVLLQCTPTTAEDSKLLMQLINESKKHLNDNAELLEASSHYHSTLSAMFETRTKIHNQKALKVSPERPLNDANLSLMLAHTDISLLKSEEDGLIESRMDDNGHRASRDDLRCRDGLLVDWLAQVDPELLIINERLQLRLLFSKSCSDFRYSLLSLVCHQTNWRTLIATLDNLLQQYDVDIDAGTALNFIAALIDNPKLWQGRDKAISKNHRPDIVVSLNERELGVFTQFILKEGETEMDTMPAKYNYKLCSRIDLLLRVTKRKSTILVKFIDYVFNSTCSQTLKFKVIQQMYLMYPSVKFIRLTTTTTGEQDAKLQSLKGCQADRVSNYLITCLGNLLLKKDFEALSSDTELLIRKLAASHPALFLRQLGVLASLIQGRGQNSLRALRDGFHFQRFIQILRTLELLQPMVFDDAYKHEFHMAIESYFTFFKHHSYAKDVYHILIKFVELLQAYINVNPSSALLFIEQYVGILMDLAAKFHSVVALHQLVQAIALLQHSTMPSSVLNEDEAKQDFELEEQADAKAGSSASAAAADTEAAEAAANAASAQLDMNSRSAVSFALSGSHNRSSSVSPHFLNLIKVVKHSSAEDAILGPLQEIESLTSKRFSFLSELFDRLLELIFSHSAQVRSNAFILLIRHLKHNPGRSDVNRCTLNAYIQCLRDDNSSVACTAVDNLAEMTLLLQEHAVEILTVAFSLGIRSRLNTSNQIKRVLQTLQLQHGY